jgi:hypothetical protein
MIFNIKELKKSFKYLQDNGFTIIEDKYFIKLKSKLEKNIIDILKEILTNKKNYNIKKYKSFNDLMRYSYKIDKRTNILGNLYDLCPANPLISSLQNDNFFLKIANSFNLKKPLLGTMNTVRFDRPRDENRNTAIHQDQWYSFLSNNAITIWFNLGKMESSLGPLKIYPKTHKKKIFNFSDINQGTFDLKNKKILTKEIELILKKNQILVFNQHLLHKSGNNISDQPRVSLQIRYNDLCNISEYKSSFRCISSDYVLKKQKKFIKHA